jgi:hypothetical protein
MDDLLNFGVTDTGSWDNTGGDSQNYGVTDPSSWGDQSPIAPTNTSSDSGVYPDPGSPTGYSDINGNQVDSTGQPVNYDSSGQLIDSNGNVIGQAGAYQTGPNDQTITPGGTDANGNPLDANGNPIQPGTQQPGAQQPGQKTGTQQPGTQNKGVLGNLLGNNNTTDTSGGSGLLGTLGMLAAGAGAGYLLSNLLSNKASTGTATVAPAHAATIAQGNLSWSPLASSGPNPGLQMGKPAQMPGQAPAPTPVAPTNG